jgi:hypothetical protein
LLMFRSFSRYQLAIETLAVIEILALVALDTHCDTHSAANA